MGFRPSGREGGQKDRATSFLLCHLWYSSYVCELRPFKPTSRDVGDFSSFTHQKDWETVFLLLWTDFQVDTGDRDKKKGGGACETKK